MTTQNTQNTSAGGAGNLIVPTGNAILDNIFSAANVAVQGAANLYGVYATVRERELQRDIAKMNARAAAQQNLPANNTSGVITLSQPETVQKLFVYGGLISLLLAGAFFVYKKV